MAPFKAPITEVVMPEECQSIPSTQPRDWNQAGSLSFLQHCSTTVFYYDRFYYCFAEQTHAFIEPGWNLAIVKREICVGVGHV